MSLPKDAQPIEITELDLSKALMISIRSEDQISVEKLLTSSTQMKKRLRKYLSKDIKHNYILLSVDRKASYNHYAKTYEFIMQEVNRVKNKIAERLFSKQYSELSEGEIREVIAIKEIKILEE